MRQMDALLGPQNPQDHLSYGTGDCGPEYYFLKAPFLGITIELFTHVSNHWPDAKSEAFKSQLTFLLLDEDAVKHKILSKNMQIILQNN